MDYEIFDNPYYHKLVEEVKKCRRLLWMVPLLNPEDLNGPFINYSIMEKINFDSLGDLVFLGILSELSKNSVDNIRKNSLKILNSK